MHLDEDPFLKKHLYVHFHLDISSFKHLRPRLVVIWSLIGHTTAVRLHVYLVFVKSIEQELKIQ